MNHNDYIEAGLRVVPLYGVTNGLCDCGDTECGAILKHPRISNWQNVPHWSDDQISAMEDAGFFRSGFGFVLDQHIIIDIDPRNGGDESYERLCADLKIDFERLANFVCNTGGGGRHIYFYRPIGVALSSHLADYPGIDFKSSGYVVGAGSLHASGLVYDGEGGLCEFAPCPEQLIELLKKKDTYRTQVDGSYIDVSEAEIVEMLSHVSPDCSYDDWVSIGMAIHQATNGGAFNLWDEWSSKSTKYPDASNLERKWHSFGKSANPITIGTLIHAAKKAGYERQLEPAVKVFLPEKKTTEPCDTSGVDLLRPPGFVGQLTEWINSQCLFKRENLAVAGALSCIGNIGGMRFFDERDGVTANTIFLCVAGTGSGKENVQGAINYILRAAGVAPAVHGHIKSEQEIVRNMLNHQACYFVVDEIGYLLRKIKGGQADYLKGVIPIIMSAYTKAASFLLISGDLKEEIRDKIKRQIEGLEKMVSQNEDQDGRLTRQLRHLKDKALPNIDMGIENPFLSICGFTTPISFHDSIDAESVMNGFINRSFIIDERETNPKAKVNTGFIQPQMTDAMRATLQFIYSTEFETAYSERRISHDGEKTSIPTTDDASALLADISDYFWEYGERLKGENGMEALSRRAYEAVAKVSFILAIPGGLRELEHVRWAFKFVQRDIENKIRLATVSINGDTKDSDEAGRVLRDKILLACSDEGETISVIVHRVGRKFKKPDVVAMVEKMVEYGQIDQFDYEWNGRKSVRYRLKG